MIMTTSAQEPPAQSIAINPLPFLNALQRKVHCIQNVTMPHDAHEAMATMLDRILAQYFCARKTIYFSMVLGFRAIISTGGTWHCPYM
jgi:hypothetical protein